MKHLHHFQSLTLLASVENKTNSPAVFPVLPAPSALLDGTYLPTLTAPLATHYPPNAVYFAGTVSEDLSLGRRIIFGGKMGPRVAGRTKKLAKGWRFPPSAYYH